MREDLIEIEIGAFSKIQNGYAFKSKEYVDKGLRIIRIANVQSGEIIDRDPKFYPGSRLSEFKDYVIEEDDFLISLTGNVGRVGRIGKSLLPALLNQRVGKLNLQTNSIEKSYLYYFLNSRAFVHQVIKSSKGVGQLNTSSKKIEAIKIPIAPLSVQRAIVAKIEELFSDLDKGIADLKKAQDQLKVYRQAVLKKAFEGELTKEWREQQQDLPTADELLEQIKEERQKHYEQQLENWKQAVNAWEENNKEGKKPGKPKAIKSVEQFTRTEIKNMDELPNKWNWVRLGNIFQIFVGSTPSRSKTEYWENGKINWISSGEVNFSSIFETREKITNEGLNNASTTIHPVGTVMLAMIGEGKTRGQAGILEIEACHNQNTAAIRVSEIGFLPKFLFHYLFLKYERNRSVGSGNNQKALNQGRIMDFDYPLCSVEEQHQIIQEIESRLSVCEKVEESIIESLEKAKALRQSVLKKAFEGTLLSKEEIAACKAAPDYEPASVLLEKIKAEKKKK